MAEYTYRYGVFESKKKAIAHIWLRNQIMIFMIQNNSKPLFNPLES